MNRAISILVHGAAKSGKSTFAASAPGPRLLLDCEGGSRFLNVKAIDWDPSKNSPPIDNGEWDTAVVTIRQYDDILKAYQWLQAGKHPFNSVVADSISEMQQKLVDKVTNREQAKTQDWGDVLRAFMGLMRDLRDLTTNPIRPVEAVILVAMSKPGEDKKLHPFAQGQSQIMLPYLFDVLSAMHIDSWSDDAGNQQQVYRLLVGNNLIYETGERVGGRIGGYMDNPTVPAILDLIFGPKQLAAVPAAEAAS